MMPDAVPIWLYSIPRRRSSLNAQGISQKLTKVYNANFTGWPGMSRA